MKKLYNIISRFVTATLIAAVALTAVSCSWGDETPQYEEEGEGAVIVLSAHNGMTKAVTDNDITTLRILMFRTTGDKSLAYNFYYDSFNSITTPIELKVRTGTFDFVFICNETSDARVHTLLSGLGQTSRLAHIDQEYFGSAAFDDDKAIPMVGRVRNLEVIEDYTIKIDGGQAIVGTWDASEYIKRLGVRVDFTMTTSNVWFYSSYEKLEILNIPKKVYFFETTSTGTALYNVTSTNDFETAPRLVNNVTRRYDVGADIWRWEKNRILVPSSVFADKANNGRALTFAVSLKDVSRTIKGTIGRDEAGGDYTSPRNHYYTLNGQLTEEALRFSIVVEAWDEAIPVDVK